MSERSTTNGVGAGCAPLLPRPPAISDWMLLAELTSTCSHALRAAIADRAGGESISEPQFALLWVCGESDEGLSQSDLAASLALSPAHISGMVEQLNERQLIAGHRSPNDRRRQIWRLTEAGRATVERVARELIPWCQALQARLQSDLRQQLETRLRELCSVLENVAETASVLPIDAPRRSAKPAKAVVAPAASGGRRSGGGAA